MNSTYLILTKFLKILELLQQQELQGGNLAYYDCRISCSDSLFAAIKNKDITYEQFFELRDKFDAITQPVSDHLDALCNSVQSSGQHDLFPIVENSNDSGAFEAAAVESPVQPETTETTFNESLRFLYVHPVLGSHKKHCLKSLSQQWQKRATTANAFFRVTGRSGELA